ncbi:MAG: DUF3006 domain-containing protein [Epulopiscium sp.]|nr:DUF3006 domain-containing protein [Candidatus Epulonipiscium sp.]
MKIIIDRFEDNYAVVELENKKLIDIPKELLPKGAKEGTVLEIRIDLNETKARAESIKKLAEDLWD